jgi:hypothetical protein
MNLGLGTLTDLDYGVHPPPPLTGKESRLFWDWLLTLNGPKSVKMAKLGIENDVAERATR